jgi:hypothetical protein
MVDVRLSSSVYIQPRAETRSGGDSGWIGNCFLHPGSLNISDCRRKPPLTMISTAMCDEHETCLAGPCRQTCRRRHSLATLDRADFTPLATEFVAGDTPWRQILSPATLLATLGIADYTAAARWRYPLHYAHDAR